MSSTRRRQAHVCCRARYGGDQYPATTTEQQNAGRDAIALQSIKFHLQKKKAYPYAENNEVSVQQFELSYDIMHFSTSAYLCRPWWVQ
jgi:hypothetical protein